MSSASAERRLLGAFAALSALLLSPEAHAQGCSACKTAAEQSGNDAINTAILVLLFPTLCIFGGIVYRAYRHR
jgi:hypothetical protein